MTNNNLSYKNFLYGWIAGVNAVIVSLEYVLSTYSKVRI